MFRQVDYLMVNVSDMRRSVAFYRDALGLPLKFESPGWSEFQTGATTLALHAVPSGAHSPAAVEGGPRAGTCSLGFSVEDLDATWETLKGRGVRFVMPPTDRTEEGILLAVGVDPDGLEISFAQSKPRGNAPGA